MNTVQRLALSLLVASTTTAGVVAAPLKFDFKDPKGVNNIQFRIDAPLESTSGQGTGITGEVTFDPAAPAATTGRIVLATASLTVGNSTMQGHLQGPMWLDAAKFPEIVFEAKSLAQAVTTGATTKADVTGVLTLHGVSREITAPVTLTYLPGKLGDRFGKPEMKGDLLVLRANFSVNRSDFGIMPGKMTDKVAERVDLTLSLAGAAPQ
jgi:polyisoprenoid-binding protein YceI